jgi:hypothetical protein
MTNIYIDPIAASMPDAADHLRHLVDTGHRVHVLGEPPAALADLPITAADTVAGTPSAATWLVTADPELCAERRPSVTTILVGPRVAPSPRPAPRCDVEARDLASAVLEILSREAMG